MKTISINRFVLVLFVFLIFISFQFTHTYGYILSTFSHKEPSVSKKIETFQYASNKRSFVGNIPDSTINKKQCVSYPTLKNVAMQVTPAQNEGADITRVSLSAMIYRLLSQIKFIVRKILRVSLKLTSKSAAFLQATAMWWLPVLSFLLGRWTHWEKGSQTANPTNRLCVETPQIQRGQLLQQVKSLARRHQTVVFGILLWLSVFITAVISKEARRLTLLAKVRPIASKNAAKSSPVILAHEGRRRHLLEAEEDIPAWWKTNKNSKHRHLIIPPKCVKKLSKPEMILRLKERAQGVKEAFQGEWQSLQRFVKEGNWEDLTWEVINHLNHAEEDDKNSPGLEWEVHDLPTLCTPVLAFVNSRSGGNAGKLVMEELQTLLNPIQVVDILEKGQPARALKQFAHLPRMRLVVAGGDGTVGWVIKEWEDANLGVFPPVGVIPLGTGNDMARSLGWGGGHSPSDRLADRLADFSQSNIAMVDRWSMKIRYMSLVLGRRLSRELSFINYFSVGVDAQAALRFHETRDSNPHLFFNRMTNKLMYAVLGADEVVARSCARIRDRVKIYADNNTEIVIPERAEGIIFLNINSYSGGVSMWDHETISIEQQSEDGPKDGGLVYREGLYECPSSKQDGRLDVVAVYGAFHLGQLQVGLAQAEKICQCSWVRVVTNGTLPMQVDGEPWAQEEAAIRISCQNQKVPMLQKTEASGGDLAEDISYVLDMAEKNSIINCTQQQAIVSGLSKRVEHRSFKSSASPWIFNI